MAVTAKVVAFGERQPPQLQAGIRSPAG